MNIDHTVSQRLEDFESIKETDSGLSDIISPYVL